MIEARPVIDVRRAGPVDADELIRLRGIMLAALTGTDPAPGSWRRTGADLLRRQLGHPSGWPAAFVVDAPDQPGIAACVVGAIDQRLPGPHNPTGRTGYVYNVATDPGYRRRGYSRACLRALLAAYDEQGVAAVDLRASADGEPLYAEFGFARTPEPGMRRYRGTPRATAGRSHTPGSPTG